MKMKHLNYYLFLLGILLCISCENSSENFLKKAESLMETAPDSALMYIDSIPIPSLTNKQLHRYHLARVQARDKTFEDISSDTIILSLKGIYDKTDSQKAAMIYLYSGKVLGQRNDYKGALEDYLNAKRYIRKEDYRYNAIITNSIGNLYYKQMNVLEAKFYFNNALKMFETEKDTINVMVTHNQLGNCFLVSNILDSAYFHYKKCEDLLNALEEYDNKSVILNDLSVAYQVAGKIDMSKQYLQEALLFEKDNKRKAKTYLNLAILYETDRDTFYYYINESLSLIEDEDLMTLATVYKIVTQYEKDSKDYAAALMAYEKYTNNLKQFYQLNEQTPLKELQHKYDLSIMKQEKMRLLIKCLVIALTIIVLFSLVVYLLTIEKQKLKEAQNRIIHLEHMSAVYNEKEESLRSFVLSHFKIMKKVALLEYQMLPNPSASKLVKKMNDILYGKDNLDWNQLYKTMNVLHNNLFDKLKQSFPQLDETEFKICCLSIAKFTNIEIGILMDYSVNTITAKKAVMRKKMGIASSGNIKSFLDKYFEE